MARRPNLDTFKLAGEDKPCIGFRVIVSSGDERYRNNPRSRHPQTYAGTLALQNHLEWMNEEPSPFVSLWTSWLRAANWAKSRARSGAEDIDIVAVWIHGQDVYDAYEAASMLRLPPEKLREYYYGEVVIVDRGWNDDFRVLARWKWVTERRWETVTFDLFNYTASPSTSLPIGKLEFEPRNDDEILENREARRWENRGFTMLAHEVCIRAGPENDSKAVMLAFLLCEDHLTRGPPCPSIWLAKLVAGDADTLRELRSLRLHVY